MHETLPEILDIVGIGFGPSNLALAVAIDEAKAPLRSLFLEQKAAFAWHPNMLLTGTVMQISFLKDLVTQRNPESRHTFINYLRQHNRLSDFINLKTFYPSRIEFNHYMAWVADSVKRQVRYGSTVQGVRAVQHQGQVLSEVTYFDESRGNVALVLARNLVVAVGGTPNVPFPMEVQNSSHRVWHSSQYLARCGRVEGDAAAKHFVVVGRGQSAAEIANDLHGRFPEARVTCLFRGYGLKPSDSSEFVNGVFDAAFVDELHELPPIFRKELIGQHQDTNYAVVDVPLISRLYEIRYRERVEGAARLAFRNFSNVLRITETERGIRVFSEDLRTRVEEAVDADYVVLATGYRYSNPPKVLSGIAAQLEIDPVTQSPQVNRHYRVVTRSASGPRVYLQGCNEPTHGLGDTLLSNLSIRSGEILADVLLNVVPARNERPLLAEEAL